MKKSKKTKQEEFTINACFGMNNQHRIFSLQSEKPALILANLLGKKLQTTFASLPDFSYKSEKFQATFQVFYTQIAQKNSVNCLLLENKTLSFNKQDVLRSSKEKKLGFQTLSLFEEWLYLINNQGFTIFNGNVFNADYLLLFYAKKDYEIDPLKEVKKQLKPQIIRDVTNLLNVAQKSNHSKIDEFLRELFCNLEVEASLYLHRKQISALGPIRNIPANNLRVQFPISLKNSKNTFPNLEFSDSKLKLLKEID